MHNFKEFIFHIIKATFVNVFDLAWKIRVYIEKRTGKIISLFSHFSEKLLI